MELSSFLSKVQEAKELDFGDVFGKSIDLFKKTWAQGFLSFLFIMLFFLPMFLIIYTPMISYAIAQESGQYSSEPPIGMMLTTLCLAIVVGMLLNTFIMALQAGLFNVIRMIDEGEEVSAKDHFKFFKAESLKKTFVLSLITMGITFLATMLCYLPVFYVLIPLSYVSLIFANNSELSVTEIIKASFSLGNKKWLISFGLLFISGILAYLIGLILCGIGILFTMSFVYLPFYYIYKKVIGFEDTDEIKQIGIEQD